MTLISVIIPSYNHAQYIEEALDCVMNQTYKDIEIIILDDSSTDNSPQIIEKFINKHTDKKIKFIKNPQNLGAVITLNRLIEAARGEYIALINSDDIWHKEKLEKQFDVINKNTSLGAVFSHAYIVDNNKQPIPCDDLPFSQVFFQENRKRGLWLRKFFFDQNCLCHPSILIRKKIYKEIGLYDARFYQLPDFEMWIRLIKHTDIYVIQEPLVYLRWHEKNTSRPTKNNKTRSINELCHIYRNFFSDMGDKEFIDGFRDKFTLGNAFSPKELECEKALMYFRADGAPKLFIENIGLNKVFDLLSRPDMEKILKEKYYFTYKEFIDLQGSTIFDKSLICYINSSNTDKPKTLFSRYFRRIKIYLKKFAPWVYNLLKQARMKF